MMVLGIMWTFREMDVQVSLAGVHKYFIMNPSVVITTPFNPNNQEKDRTYIAKIKTLWCSDEEE